MEYIYPVVAVLVPFLSQYGALSTMAGAFLAFTFGRMAIMWASDKLIAHSGSLVILTICMMTTFVVTGFCLRDDGNTLKCREYYLKFEEFGTNAKKSLFYDKL